VAQMPYLWQLALGRAAMTVALWAFYARQGCATPFRQSASLNGACVVLALGIRCWQIREFVRLRRGEASQSLRGQEPALLPPQSMNGVCLPAAGTALPQAYGGDTGSKMHAASSY
jgi:hypothetical protein